MFKHEIAKSHIITVQQKICSLKKKKKKRHKKALRGLGTNDERTGKFKKKNNNKAKN